jgi:hypothetical protein
MSKQKKDEISCPYCGHRFRGMPRDHTACPNCKQILYVYDSVLGGRKVILTEEGLSKIIKAKALSGTQDYFTARLNELAASFQKAQATTTHYGELGRELENRVKDLLQEFLPNKYEISTGFVRSLERPKWRSNQIDILLGRNDICYPIAVHNEYRVYPIESIISFVEVTSNLTKGKLREDYEKVADLQRLHKRMYYIPMPPAGVAPYPTDAVHPRFYYFAFSTDSSVDTLSRWLLEMSNEYRTQLHALFVLTPSVCLVMPNAEPDYDRLIPETRPQFAISVFLQHILMGLQTADFIPANASLPLTDYTVAGSE